MAELEENIREGDYSIEVRETRMGKMAVLNKGGERTLDPQEQDELEDLLEQYEDVILKLWETDQELSGHERAWHMGEIYHEEVNESNERQIHTLNVLLPFASDRNRIEYHYRLFYEMFPNKEYENEYPVTVLSELAQRTSPQEAREIYNEQLLDSELDLKREEIRAWADTTGPDLVEAVQELKIRSITPKVKSVNNIFQLHGAEELPPDEEIEEALENVEE